MVKTATRVQLLLLSLLLAIPGRMRADGGMYPISMIDKVPLEKAGMRISRNDIYNTKGGGLLQAIVQLSGCTGSFVSAKGLIVTNHHCAFGTLGRYSTPENNLLEKGYYAKDSTKELRTDLTCRIMVSHKDLSADVLKGTAEIKDAVERRKLINKNLESIRQMEALKDKNIEIEIGEMLPGKSYILFRYRTLRDVRIVYIPARNIGEFGGESDNWVWPRHNADFAFVRAYVNRKGEGVAFDSANVPYEPQEYLNVNAGGVQESDFVMILGYPGRTFRHQPSAFLHYHQNVLLPYISNLYEWQINTIHQLGETRPAWKIGMDPKVKSLANTKKNYQGKLQTLKAIDLYNTKVQEEQQLLRNLSSQPALRKEFEYLLYKNDSLYKLVEADAKKYLWQTQLLRENTLIKIAHVLDHYSVQYPKLSAKPEDQAKLKKQSYEELRRYYRSMHLFYDTTYLKKMMRDAQGFEGKNQVAALKGITEGKPLDVWFAEEVKETKILDSNYVYNKLLEKPSRIRKLDDPFIKLSSGVYSEYKVLDSTQTNYRIQLDNMLPRYVDIKMQATDQLFIPDANSTLRLTYGYIKGYEPADGMYYEPQTDVAGMFEKEGSNPDYNVNTDLRRTYLAQKTSPYHDQKKDNLTVAMLYNTDTSGGNSGSPILNKDGELIGVNFDRAYAATVNDYAWNERYSRSIGVDIRFVLWVTKYVAGADRVINEMFIQGVKKP